MSSEASRVGRAPARLVPIFVPRIWGARDLAPLFPGRGREPEPIGEAWLTGNECLFATGEFAGRPLGEVWPTLPKEWTGTRLAGLPRMPLLVKFIFPEEKLSVQVHPDDVYAEEHEAAAGGAGKTEMWYVIRAREGAELLVGLHPNVTRESFQRAIIDGTVEDCLTHVPVRAGDAVFVPAGTAHTICPGVMLCEIQQHSDITYRVFDYNRIAADGKPRALHI
ncbi:MAG: class I mannose-6-phosphate isomerase, partial [Candidatus Acidiferrales bacterium]